MTWQAVALIAFVPVTIWMLLLWHSWVTYCEKEKYISDNDLKIEEVKHKTAAIPRSIFGSGFPATPAAMHHSGGIGHSSMKRPNE